MLHANEGRAEAEAHTALLLLLLLLLDALGQPAAWQCWSAAPPQGLTATGKILLLSGLVNQGSSTPSPAAAVPAT